MGRGRVWEIVSSLFLMSQCRADSADGMARDEHNLEVVGASLGKGEADIQEMDGVLGKRAGCGRWGNKKLTHLGGLDRWL